MMRVQAVLPAAPGRRVGPPGSVRAGTSARLTMAILLACAPVAPLGAQALTLRDAVALAQRQGLAARSASSAREAARWRDRAFSASLLPQVSLRGDLPTYSRSDVAVPLANSAPEYRTTRIMGGSASLEVSQLLPFTGGELFVSSQLVRTDWRQERAGLSPLTDRSYRSAPVVVGIRQDLFRPNAVRWNDRLQDVAYTLAERRYVESREDVALSTTSAFFDLYAAEMSVANATANVAVNDTLYALNTGRFDVGKIGENDLLQSELAVLRARNSLDGALLERDRARAALRILLGVDRDAPLAIVAPDETPRIAADTSVAVAQALRNRSQMTNAELQTLQARREVAEARSRAGFGATVAASVGLNQRDSVFGGVYRDPLEEQQFALSVAVPLMQWGGGRAGVEAARAERSRAEDEARLSRETIEQEAHFAALQLALAERQLAIAAKADTVGSKRFEVAKNRYVIGKIGISDLYIAQSEKDAALLSYVGALRGYWTAYYRLRRLTLYDFAENRPIPAQ